MFRRLLEDRARVVIRVNGRAVEARAGDSVAAAMLAANLVCTRLTATLEAAGGPYCGIGACFDCLVTIDGVGNQRGCMVEVVHGMELETQSAKRDLAR